MRVNVIELILHKKIKRFTVIKIYLKKIYLFATILFFYFSINIKSIKIEFKFKQNISKIKNIEQKTLKYCKISKNTFIHCNSAYIIT